MMVERRGVLDRKLGGKSQGVEARSRVMKEGGRCVGYKSKIWIRAGDGTTLRLRLIMKRQKMNDSWVIERR